ncbi:LPXTG cell wall anchor domain-containing protein [Oxalobacteraceae bacterium]|nr:LPXTG cell wall anchor domain-containing protein [Oxalobacteraceae bacterium]
MQRRLPTYMHGRGAAAVLAAFLSLPVHAAELGEVIARSYIGQQLTADIELIALAPDEQASLPVRLAQPDVYAGSNIRMNPALSGVHMSVLRRDQRQFLHITTSQPIEANYLHLFVELGAPGRQVVRAATVWLQSDPRPAAPPPVAVTAPLAASLEQGETVPSDAALLAAMARARRLAAAQHAAPAPAPVAAARRAPSPRPAATSTVASAQAAADVAAPEQPLKIVEPKRVPALEAARAEPKAPVRAPAAAPAACAAKGGISAKECVALDYRNAALSSKLVELEDKLKVMQFALEGKRAPAVRAPVSAAAAAVPGAAAASGTGHGATAAQVSAGASARASAEAGRAPASAGAAASATAATSATSAAALPIRPVLPKLKWRDKKEKPPETGPKTSTLIAAGTGALALLGGLGYWLWRRKKKGGKGGAPLKIWQGWRKKKPAEGGAGAAVKEEPVLPPEAVHASD